MLVWGFFISTVLCWHATYTINSLSHLFGRQRYRTGDTSRNNWLLALLTLGEGWHNNHHYYPNAARQGFYWWEYDITYYLLKLMSWLGLIWDLKPRAGGGTRKPAPPDPLTPRARRAGAAAHEAEHRSRGGPAAAHVERAFEHAAAAMARAALLRTRPRAPASTASAACIDEASEQPLRPQERSAVP